MSNEAASLVMSIDSSGVKTAVVDLDKLTATAEKAEAATNRITQASAKSSAGYSGLTQATAAVSVSAEKYIKTMQAELDMLGRTRAEMERYNAGMNGLDAASARQVEAIAKKIDAYHREEQVMKDVASAQDKASAAAEKFIAKLKYETETASLTTKELAAYKAAKLGVSDAAAPLIAAMKESGHAMDGFSLSSSVAKRELLVMSRELGRGDFTKLGSSFSIFAQSSGLMAMAMKPLGLAIGAVAAAAGLAAVAFFEGSKESHAFTEAIINTGNYAGLTKGQLTDMSAAVAKTVGSQHAAADALAQLGATGRIAGTDMAAFAVTAVRASEASGVAIKDTVAEFVKLGQDPVKESARLNESMHYLTGAVFEQINSLVALGKTDEAATLAQKTYADAVDDRAKQIKTSLGYLESGWHSIGKAASNAWSAMMGVGRDLSISDQISKLQGQIVTGQAGSKTGSIFDKGPVGAGSFNDEQNKKIQEQIALLQATQRETQKLASLDGERAKIQEKSVEAQTKVNASIASHASATEKMNKELAESKKQYDAIRAANPNSELLKTEATEIERITANYTEKTKAQKKSSDAYGTMLASIAKANEAALLELSTDEKLTAADRFRIQKLSEIDEMLRKKNITLTQAVDLENRANDTEGVMNGVIAANAARKATEALAKAHEQYIGVLENNLNTTQADTDKLRQQTAELGLSKEAIAGLRAAEMDRQATATDGLAINALVNSQAVDSYNVLVKTADAIRAKSAAMRDFGAAETAADQAKKIKDNDVKLLESVDKAAESAFINIAENGSNAFKKIGKTLQTAVLDLLYQLTVKKFIVNIVGSVTGAGVAQQALGATSDGSGVGNMLSSASSIGSLGSGVGLLGAGGLGLQAGFGALMTSGFAGVSAAVSGGLAAIGVGTGASIAAGLGVIAGALGPIALGVFAVSSLFGKGDSRYGSQYDYNPTSGTNIVGGPNAGVDFNGQSASQNATITGINTILSTLGSSAFVNRFTSGFESSEKGKGFSYAGGGLSNGAVFGQGTDGNGYNNNRGSMTNEQAQASYIKELKQATIQALQAATDIPESISKSLAGINIDALTDEALNQLIASIDAQITAATGLRQALNLLPMDQLRDMSMKTAFALAEASGGFAALGTKLSSYYENFYSAEEKRAQTIKNINAATEGSGLDAATATRDQFRKLVESQDITTASGQKTYAALLAVADAFAGITPAAVAGAAAVEQISQIMGNLIKERSALQANLLDAQGDKGAANAIRRTEATIGFSAAEIAAYDYNRALEAQVVALQAATAAAQVTASERAGLQGQLDQLTMTSAELLNKQRDALNSSNRALFDQVQAATAAQAATQKAAAITQQRGQMEITVMQLQGNAAGALAAQRKLELAALDATLRPLQQVIYGLQDVAVAAQKAAAITQQRGQMEITVMQLQGNAAGALAAQRKLELAALDATLRPLQQVIYGLQDIAIAAQAAATAANVAAQAYFAQIDRNKNIVTLTNDATSGIDKFFGTIAESSNAGLDAANAALGASKTAAANWRGIASTIQSTLDGLRSQTSTLMGNGYESTRAQFASLSALAAGGDAASAGKLSGAASAFLAASDMNSRTLADYLRDRAAVENSLAKTMTIANLQATAQESISASSAAAVTQLTAMNANLTGFSAQVFQLLQNGYKGADRPTATAAAASLARATADYANYFATTSEGASREYNGGTLTRLAGDVARFTSASGVVDYLRGSDSVLDTAKRVSGFRDQIATQYGLNLPSYDVGTNFVPRDMIAQIHEGEAIVPRAYNPAAGGGDNSTAAELKALRADFAKLLTSMEQGNKNTQVTAEAMQGQQRRPLLVTVTS